MPIGPSGSRPPVFVGRNDEIKLFEDAFFNPQLPNEYRILSLYAFGGQGKTALLGAYRRWLLDNGTQTPCATIDLDDSEQCELIPALISCRNALAKSGVGTFAFDCAFARYHALTRIGRDIRVEHPELFTFGPGIGDLMELTNDVFLHWPGAALLKKALSRLGSDVTRWYHSRGQSLLDHLDNLDAASLRADLPMFLGADLRRHAAEHPGARPVVLVDGYERLWSDHPAGSTSDAADLWLRRLVEEAPGCLFVVAGRRPIKWQRIDREWGNVLQPREILGLQERNVDYWLDQAGVLEEPIRQRIKQSAAGHPLSITLQVSSYGKIKARGQTPHPEDFPLTQKDVIDRFISHLEAPLRAVYQIVAVPRRVDRSVWAHMQRSGLMTLEQYGFTEVAEEVFFQGLDPERRIMHPVVRSHLLAAFEAQNPELLRRVQLAVFDYLDRAASPDPPRRASWGIPDRSSPLFVRDGCLSEAADLLAASNPRGFVPWCIGLFRREQSARASKLRVTFLERALQMPEDDLAQKVELARLHAETNPFSGHAEALLEGALSGGTAMNNETREDLESIVEFLTKGEMRVCPQALVSKLRARVNEGTVASLRLALGEGDATAALRNAELLLELSPLENLCPYLMTSAAALSGDRGFALRVASRWLDRADAEAKMACACRFVKACLLIERPEWALAGLKQGYRASSRAYLLSLVKQMPEAYRDVLAALISETLSVLGDFTSAFAVLEDQLGKHGISVLQNFASYSAGFDQDRLRSEWKLLTAENECLSTHWYLHALSRLHSDSEDFRRLATTCDSLAIEVAINDRSECIVFVNDPLFCWRANDFIGMLEDFSELWFPDLYNGFLSVPLRPELAKYFSQAGSILLVCMADKSEPVLGYYRNTFAINPCKLDEIREKLLNAAKDVRESFRKAALEKPG